MLFVASVKPAGTPGWSNFCRLRLEESGSGTTWSRIDGSWNLGALTTGLWSYQGGNLTLVDQKTTAALCFQKLHWNFRHLCQQQDLTGPGMAGPKVEKITWVLGPPSRPKPKPKPPQYFYPVDPSEIFSAPDLGMPPPEPKSPKGKNFKIRAKVGVNAGEGVVGDLIVFQVWDTDNNLIQEYNYYGGGLGAGTPSSLTTEGPWNDFSTEKPVGVWAFQGPARWTSAGAGPASKNILHIPFPLGTDKGVYMEVNTGTTIGAGASTTVGLMVPASQDPVPFNKGKDN